MSNVNTSTVVGNLGADAELRYTKEGAPVARFSVATDRSVKQADGTWGAATTWVPCVMLGKRGEGLAPHLVKGSKVCVQGSLRESSWTTAAGERRSKLELVVDEIDLMGGPRAAERRQSPPEWTPVVEITPTCWEEVPYE